MKRVKIVSRRSKNPLFEKWLLEWKNVALERGAENHHTYNRALKALQKYPIVLKSGKECMILENFGNKICQMLDKKLEEYKKTISEDEWKRISGDDPSDSYDYGLPASSSQASHTASSSQSSMPSVTNTLPTSPKTAKTKQVKKSPAKNKNSPYVPKFRSGAYALLLALCKEPLGLTKAKLIDAAQTQSDASFSKAPPGSHYTAWASMATLIKKNFVVKEGKPILFKLTDSGMEVASKLANLSEEEIEIFSAETPPPMLPSQGSQAPQKTRKRAVRSPINFGSGDLSPTKIDWNTYPSPSNSESQTDSGIGIHYGLHHHHQVLTKNLPVISSTITSASQISEQKLPRDLPSKPSNFNHVSSSNGEITTSSSSGSRTWSKSAFNGGVGKTAEPNSVRSHLGNSQGLTKTSVDSQSASEEPQDTVFLFAGQFKIILLVDIHETDLRNKKRVDSTLQQLLATGVLAETRHLTVGDFTWIARDREGFELVLPYVVERKRMDDMAASIKDGRFHEQKFRLKGCGLPNVIYLVEQYGNSESFGYGMPIQSLKQAAINTQVVDQFNVKITKNFEDSIRYLACFTKQLIRIFKDKTLMSCHKKSLPEPNISSDLLSLMTFKQFNKDSTKIRNWTVKEMLLKQLIQLKTLSVDKATAIVERYPTPTALVSALMQPGGEKQLADLQYTPLKRIGPAIAKTLHQLYTLPSLP